MFDALREELGKKCSLDDLYKSDALLLEKVDDIAGALIKKLADKKEVVNSLNYLDVRVFIFYYIHKFASRADTRECGEFFHIFLIYFFSFNFIPNFILNFILFHLPLLPN